jgi:hypothetical protein
MIKDYQLRSRVYLGSIRIICHLSSMFFSHSDPVSPDFDSIMLGDNDGSEKPV